MGQCEEDATTYLPRLAGRLPNFCVEINDEESLPQLPLPLLLPLLPTEIEFSNEISQMKLAKEGMTVSRIRPLIITLALG